MTDKDATTEAELRAIFAHLDPVPQLLDDAARAAFTWRTVDEELAELMRDSAERGGGGATSCAAPAGPRQLSFESPRLGIELEVVADRAARAPPGGPAAPAASATVTIERPGEDGLSVQADELGRFVLDGLRAGVVRLHVRCAARRSRSPGRRSKAAARPPARRAGSPAAARAVTSRAGAPGRRRRVARPLRDIVRAIIAAVIGEANEVPSHAAQPSKAIDGSVGIGSSALGDLRSCPSRTSTARFDAAGGRVDPPAVVAEVGARCHVPSFSSTAPTASTCSNAAGQNGRLDAVVAGRGDDDAALLAHRAAARSRSPAAAVSSSV